MLRAGAIALAAIGLWGFSVLVQEREYGFAFLAASALAALSLFEFLLADVIVDARFPRESAEFLERLRTKLTTTPMEREILQALQSCVTSFGGCDADRLSSTVHLRVNVMGGKADEPTAALVQLSDYTRSGLGGQRWRISDPAKGIIGRCLRVEEKVWVNFRTANEYRTRMVEEFGYTADEAMRHTTAGRSYLAYPLTYGGAVIGVLFFFSTEPQVFPLAASNGRLQEAADTITGLLRVAEVLM